MLTFQSQKVGGVEVFYREAGPPDAPVRLLHGFPTVSHNLILYYASNLALYPAFQDYFRTHRPPLLAIWGQNDPHFLPAGALAYRRDLPDAEIVLPDTGHFALKTHAAEIGDAMRRFLAIHIDEKICGPSGSGQSPRARLLPRQT